MNLVSSSQPPTFDPNWFLSTTAQSTAALVAIVGGFLISRLITTLSEKSQYLQNLAVLVNRRRVKSDELEKFQERVQWRTHIWFKEQHLKEIVEGKGKSDLTDMVENFNVRGSEQEEIARYAQDLQKRVARAFKDVSEKYQPPSSIPETWEEMKQDGVQIEDEEEGDLFQMVATYIANTRYKIKKERREEVERMINFPSINLNFPKYEFPSIKPTTPSIVFERHDNAIKETERLSEEIDDLNGEISLLRERIPALEKPTRLIHGFIVLAYFSIAGIVYPLFLMTRNPVVVEASARTRVLAAFGSGLALLLGFIWNAVSELRKASLEIIELND